MAEIILRLNDPDQKFSHVCYLLGCLLETRQLQPLTMPPILPFVKVFVTICPKLTSEVDQTEENAHHDRRAQ